MLSIAVHSSAFACLLPSYPDAQLNSIPGVEPVHEVLDFVNPMGGGGGPVAGQAGALDQSLKVMIAERSQSNIELEKPTTPSEVRPASCRFPTAEKCLFDR